jgi:hypothetical protein
LRVLSLGYNAQFLEFVEMKKGLQFLETRKGVLFLVSEVQSWFASRILSPTHQIRFGKNNK